MRLYKKLNDQDSDIKEFSYYFWPVLVNTVLIIAVLSVYIIGIIYAFMYGWLFGLLALIPLVAMIIAAIVTAVLYDPGS